MALLLAVFCAFVSGSNGVDVLDGYIQGDACEDDIVRRAKESDRDVCIKCTNKRENLVYASCDLFAPISNPKITKQTLLVEDGKEGGSCPITPSDLLYRVVSDMMESKDTIFEQMSVYDSITMPDNYIPPKWTDLSKQQQAEYSMYGSIPVTEWHIVELQNEGHSKLEWTEREMSERVQLIKSGNFSASFSYDIVVVEALNRLVLSNKYRHLIQDANALVVGTQIPWIETIALAAGVGHVTTAEYATINVSHPKMSWIHPKDQNAAGIMDEYDVAFTFSSVEHSGLGRYGDPLNPVGDIQAMAQISCLLKPGGLLFWGAPVGVDAIHFNAHRIYGPHRLRLMFMQFRVIDAAPEQRLLVGHGQQNWGLQPWIVLQNKRGCAQYA